ETQLEYNYSILLHSQYVPFQERQFAPQCSSIVEHFLAKNNLSIILAHRGSAEYQVFCIYPQNRPQICEIIDRCPLYAHEGKEFATEQYLIYSTNLHETSLFLRPHIHLHSLRQPHEH